VPSLFKLLCLHSAVATVALAAALAASGPPARAQEQAKSTSPNPDRAAATLNPLPAELIFKRAAYGQPALAPDGRFLAVLVPTNDRRNLALIDLDKRSAMALTGFKELDVASFRWIADSLLEVRTADLSEASGNLFIRNTVLVTAEGKVLRSFPFGSGISHAIDREGRKLIVYGHDRSSRSLDAWMYDPVSGRRELLTADQPGDVSSYLTDRAGVVRFAMTTKDNGKLWGLYYRSTQTSPWKLVQEVPAEDRRSLEPVGFMPDNRTVVVRARRGPDQDKEALYLYDAETQQFGELLHSVERIDAGGLVFDAISGQPVGVRYAGSTHWLDPSWEALQKGVDAALPRQSNQISWARFAPHRVLVRSSSDRNPGRFFLLDRKSGKMEEVASAMPWLSPEILSERRFVQYKARDGLEIPGFLTLPRGLPAKGLPLVVDIHGGPFVPGYGPGFDAEAQFLASRGMAVLQPNFRGTLGYGDKFAKAGWKQYGLAMQDDITDGVKWLIERGIVDPKRVCLMGASYGGYATLMGLIKEPGMFRCGIAAVALADLELKFSVTWSDYMRSEGYRFAVNGMLDTVGDPVKDRDIFRANSPIYQAARMSAPVLLAYGGEDQRVPIVHGRKLRAALDAAGKPYEWVVYADEGHGFNKDANRFDYYRRVDAFLRKHLDLPPAPAEQAPAN
jgi:dipeptidyl aminopeptidase/acylaminoacyl peptidase